MAELRCFSSKSYRFVVALVLLAGLCGVTRAQNPGSSNAYDIGTPAESKTGLAGLSTYAEDKLETVNIANGNLNIHIPLVTVGGRGSASYTIALSYNSKIWGAFQQTEVDKGGVGTDPPLVIHHYAASFDDRINTTPNVLVLGAGWTLPLGPAIKAKGVTTDPAFPLGPDKGNLWVLSKIWLELPDGSEVELRDDQVDGMPYATPIDPSTGQHLATDGPRGRSWHSTDGSAITYITDVDNGGAIQLNGALSGWVFLADGTRLRMVGADIGGSARCTEIMDRNGNFVTIAYDTPSTGQVTYTDQLGRQVIIQGSGEPVTVTIKGYNGVADRSYTISMGAIVPGDTTSVASNLRADYRNTTRPIISGDYTIENQNLSPVIVQHSLYPNTPHTDLFPISDIAAADVDMSQVTGVTTLSLLDGRSFQFLYNPYGEVAEIDYPGGGVSQLDYGPYGSGFCQGVGGINAYLNRRVTKRTEMTQPGTVDAVWTYTRGFGTIGSTQYPTVTVQANQGSATGTLLLSEVHYFLKLDADDRHNCVETTGASNGTGYELFGNGKEFQVQRQTNSGTQTEAKTWQLKSAVAWASGSGTYVGTDGQPQIDNDDRVTEEDTTLDTGLVKKVVYDFDAFNNETSIKDYDFGSGAAGALLQEITRVYVGDPGAPAINPNTSPYLLHKPEWIGYYLWDRNRRKHPGHHTHEEAAAERDCERWRRQPRSKQHLRIRQLLGRFQPRSHRQQLRDVGL